MLATCRHVDTGRAETERTPVSHHHSTHLVVVNKLEVVKVSLRQGVICRENTAHGLLQHPLYWPSALYESSITCKGNNSTLNNVPNSLIMSQGPSPTPTITMDRGYLEACTMADRVGRSLVTCRERRGALREMEDSAISHLSISNNEQDVILQGGKVLTGWLGCESCNIPQPPTKPDQVIQSLDTTDHFGSAAVTHGNHGHTSLAALFDNYNHCGFSVKPHASSN